MEYEIYIVINEVTGEIRYFSTLNEAIKAWAGTYGYIYGE